MSKILSASSKMHAIVQFVTDTFRSVYSFLCFLLYAFLFSVFCLSVCLSVCLFLCICRDPCGVIQMKNT